MFGYSYSDMSSMMSGGWGVASFFSWLTYLLLIILLALGIVALWKYIGGSK